jgi:hypothetical protein
MAHVIVVGCGNIGSQLVPHFARLAGIDKVTLVDDQFYEAKNVTSQAIDAADIGKPKSRVQARRLRRIKPDLDVEVVVGLVESLPRGSLRCDLILSGLDSKLARMRLGQAVWRLGSVPWIDAGVDPDNLLARGWDLAEKLTNNLSRRVLSRSLASLGLRRGEIFSVGNGMSERHFEITVTGSDPKNSGAG